MAQIYSVTARFMRRIQVREYEPAEAEVTLSAELADGESIAEAIAEVFGEASEGVHAALGLPANTSLAPRAGTTLGATAAASGTAGVTRPAGGKRKAAQQSAATVQSAATGEVDPTASAAKPAAQAPAKAAAPAVADEDPTAPAAKPAAQQPVQAAQAAAGDDIAKLDLAKYVGDLVRNGKVNSVQVKAVYPKFGVQRIADLKLEQKADFKAAVDGLVANAAAAADL